VLLIECRRVEVKWSLVEFFHLMREIPGVRRVIDRHWSRPNPLILIARMVFDQRDSSLFPVSLDSLIDQFYILGL